MDPVNRQSRDPLQARRQLSDKIRNEQQKALFLVEVGRLRQKEVASAIDRSKKIVEISRKLCEKTERQETGPRIRIRTRA